MSEPGAAADVEASSSGEAMGRRWVLVEERALERGRGNLDVATGHWPSRGGDRVFVCVHGLGGSAVNWMLLAPLLAEQGEVWAPELAGFGLTAPTGRGAGVSDNVDLLRGFIRTVAGGRPVVLLGNSMGGLVSILIAAAAPDLVAGLVLVAPASPRPLRAPLDRRVASNFALMAVPSVGERWLDRRRARLTPAEHVRETMTLCGVDPAEVDPAAIAAHEDMVRRRRHLPYASSAFLQAARSILLLIGPRAAVLWRSIDGIDCPVLLLHGERDRLVTGAGIAALAHRRNDWDMRSYPELGHIPMLEEPSRVADDIADWLGIGVDAEPAVDGRP